MLYLIVMRVFYLTSLLVFMACSVPDAAAQQAAVRGFVTDASSEEALQGATVALTDEAGVLRGTATDGDGYFILNRIPAGAYTLRISFIGYAPHEEALTLTGGVAERQVALAVQESEIGEVVVEAEGETGITTVAAGLQTVAAAQIERVPMPGVTGDLASYLQTVPGVVIQGDRGGQFFIRGGAVDQNLALLDGIPIYMPFHILSFYSAFPEEIINNADVYTGGYGARYGGRLSSMIDVRTRNGNKQNLAGTVSAAPFLSTARIEGPLLKNRVSVIASVRESLVERAFPDLFGQRFPYRFGDRFGKLHAFINPNHSFSVTALHTSDAGDIAGSSKAFDGEIVEDIISDSTEIAWDNTVLGGRYVYLSTFLPLLAEFTGGYSEMNNAFGPPDARERTANVSSIDLAGHFTYFLRRGEAHFGATYRATDLAYELGGLFQDFSSEEESLTEVTGYADVALNLDGGKFQLQPGLHLYALPDRGRQWLEPRIRAVWRPGEAESPHQINAAWGLYHQVITGLNDERDIGNLFTAWVTTPEDAPTPRAMHAILGWNMRIMANLSVAAEGFFKDFDQLSVPIFSPFPRFTTALQSADGMAYGFDLRLDLSGQPFWLDSVLDGYVSYAFSRVEYETETVSFHPAHDRRHNLNALLHAERDEIGVTLQWQYGTGLPYTKSSGFDIWYLLTPSVDVSSDPGLERVVYGEPFGGRQPAYQRLDLWLERRVEQGRYVGTLRAGALNIFNRKNLFYFDLFTLQRVDQLPFIPSVGLKVELR